MNAEHDATATQAKPAWKPLPSIQRRIVGVLVEKAKTTPDQYPLSLNGLINGCNQKSNRSPQMTVDQNQVEDALEQLRQAGAVGEVQGSGRVPKYRHYLKDWLGVDGMELAVMTELLLRGDQTIGELRGRANRMTRDEIPDVAALQPVLQSLTEKGLLISLTPPGRGQSVTHALYEERELPKVRQRYEGGALAGTPPTETSPAPPREEVSWTATRETSPPPASRSQPPSDDDQVESLRREVAELREEVSRLKREVEDIWSSLK